jgi:hypothetical protein
LWFFPERFREAHAFPPAQKRNKIEAAKASMVAAEKSIAELEATLSTLSSARADSVRPWTAVTLVAWWVIL